MIPAQLLWSDSYYSSQLQITHTLKYLCSKILLIHTFSKLCKLEGFIVCTYIQFIPVLCSRFINYDKYNKILKAVFYPLNTICLEFIARKQHYSLEGNTSYILHVIRWCDVNSINYLLHLKRCNLHFVQVCITRRWKILM